MPPNPEAPKRHPFVIILFLVLGLVLIGLGYLIFSQCVDSTDCAKGQITVSDTATTTVASIEPQEDTEALRAKFDSDMTEVVEPSSNFRKEKGGTATISGKTLLVRIADRANKEDLLKLFAEKNLNLKSTIVDKIFFVETTDGRSIEDLKTELSSNKQLVAAVSFNYVEKTKLDVAPKIVNSNLEAYVEDGQEIGGIYTTAVYPFIWKWDYDGNSPYWRHANYYLKQINAPALWNIPPNKVPTKVMVIDTPIGVNPALEPKIKFRAYDTSGELHGTHIAGIIAADGSGSRPTGVARNVGIYSFLIDYGTDTDLVDMKDIGVETLSTFLKGLESGINNFHPRVINISSGSPINGEGVREAEYLATQPIWDWIGEQGVIIVTAAGNQGNNSKAEMFSGQSYARSQGQKNIFVVCNTSDEFSLKKYDPKTKKFGIMNPDQFPKSITVAKDSTLGFVDVCAPGYVMSTDELGSYQWLGGTSMSAPVVTGVIAELFSINPNLTIQDIRSAFDALPVAYNKNGTDIRILDAFKLLENIKIDGKPALEVASDFDDNKILDENDFKFIKDEMTKFASNNDANAYGRADLNGDGATDQTDLDIFCRFYDCKAGNLPVTSDAPSNGQSRCIDKNKEVYYNLPGDIPKPAYLSSCLAVAGGVYQSASLLVQSNLSIDEVSKFYKSLNGIWKFKMSFADPKLIIITDGKRDVEVYLNAPSVDSVPGTKTEIELWDPDERIGSQSATVKSPSTNLTPASTGGSGTPKQEETMIELLQRISDCTKTRPESECIMMMGGIPNSVK